MQRIFPDRNSSVRCARIDWIAAAFGLVTAATAVAQDRNGQPDGRELYGQACVTCHASDGRGRSQAEVGFSTPLPDFTDCDFANREPDLDWTAVIHDGGPARGFNRMMPAFGEALTDEEIAAVLGYVRGLCRNPDWPRGDLNLPRTLFTEKAFPEDEAVIEGSVVTEGNDAWTSTFVWEQRFGTRNQIELSLPVTRAEIGDEGWKSGAGDIGLGVKHVLRHSFERGSILSVGGELVFATGDEQRGFGKGSNVFESYLSYGKLLPNDSFIQLQGIAEFPTKPEFDDELAVRAAIGRTWTGGGRFGRSWTPIIEVLGARDRVSGADTNWDVVPQFQVSLNTRQHILANFGVRVPASDRSSRETEFVFYLLWDWFDGGVLEGW